jgi:hypothetical protein
MQFLTEIFPTFSIKAFLEMLVVWNVDHLRGIFLAYAVKKETEMFHLSFP